MKSEFFIALVGRPNVGKSRLFNRLSHSRRSIVHDQAGITRDIVSMELSNGATLMDTGGIGLQAAHTPAKITEAVEQQVDFAIQMADLILFVLDGKSGLLPLDLEIAQSLRKTGKTVLPIINKIDHEKNELQLSDFHSLGFSCEPILISAEHNRGIEHLEEIIQSYLPKIEKNAEESQNSQPIAIAFIGAPNVGKSSLSNAILKSDRMIVSDVAGTTRDSIFADFDITDAKGQNHRFRLVDTAGLRAPKKIDSSVEYFSSVRTQQALEEADVVFLVLDATRGLTKYDKKIAQIALEKRKNLAVIVNKWDLAEKAIQNEELTHFESINQLKDAFKTALLQSLFSWIDLPILFTSATETLGIETIARLALKLHRQSQQHLSTGRLNAFFQKKLEERQPAKTNGKRFKIYYAVQTSSAPIVIRIYANRYSLISPSYEQYLRRNFIEHFQLGGSSVSFEFISKPVREAPSTLKKATSRSRK